jgi:hypothetical protein
MKGGREAHLHAKTLPVHEGGLSGEMLKIERGAVWIATACRLGEGELLLYPIVHETA